MTTDKSGPPSPSPQSPSNPQTLATAAAPASRRTSAELFARAQRVIPGGVNSPVRAFKAVGGDPVFFARAEGPYLHDVDGNRYIDYVGSWGPMILGHCHPEVLAAVTEAAAAGTSFGAPTEREVRFAELLTEVMPSLQRVRMVSSGTEATMSALRLARGFTGRSQIIKIDGAYHGHADSLLVAAGSGAATLGIPGSAGVTPGATRDTLTVAWNDLPAVRELCLRSRDDKGDCQLAAIIVEPVCGNMGCVPPAPGYLQGLRELTREHGIVLIFDEVMTGFRVAYGGAQALYGVTPDLTCLGKIVGGGLPAAAYGGRADIMDFIAPVGPVYQAGTLSGNPLAMAAGQKMVQLLQQGGAELYEELERQTTRLTQGLLTLCQEAGVAATVNQVGSMFTLFFSDAPVTDYTSAKRSDTARFGRFFRGMLERGVYLPPSQFEAAFVSAGHSGDVIDATLSAARAVLRSI